MTEYSFNVCWPADPEEGELLHFTAFTATPANAAAVLESVGAYAAGDIAQVEIVGGETWLGELSQTFQRITAFDQFLERVRAL